MTTEQNCTIVGELPPVPNRRPGRPQVWPQRLAVADDLPPDHWVRFDGKDDAETAWGIPSWFGQSWERYIEPPTKPEWLNEAWVNIYGDCIVGPYNFVGSSDHWAFAGRIGRVNLGTGEWVPCNGQQVLA